MLARPVAFGAEGVVFTASATIVDNTMRDTVDEFSLPTEFAIVSVLLGLASGVRTRLSEVFETRGLSWPRYEILAYVCRTGPVPYSIIARELVRHRTSVTAIVGALEGAGLVSKYPNPQKPQQFLVHSTDSGLREVRRATEALRKLQPQWEVSGDSDRLLRTLRDLEQHWVARGGLPANRR